MPVMVPEPLILIVPVLVKLARTVVVAPVPELLIIPALARVVTEHVPLRASVLPEAFVNEPAPDKAVVTERAPLLV